MYTTLAFDAKYYIFILNEYYINFKSGFVFELNFEKCHINRTD